MMMMMMIIQIIIIIIIIIIIEYIKSITNYSPPISLIDHHHIPKSHYLLLTMRGSIVSFQ